MHKELKHTPDNYEETNGIYNELVSRNQMLYNRRVICKMLLQIKINNEYS